MGILPMGILADAKPAIVICTRDRAATAAFYRDILGLTQTAEDKYANVFETGGITLRVSTVPDFTPHTHTILGFRVPDVPAAVKALTEKGVTFNIYPGFGQDEDGVWTVPNGSIQTAWMQDPEGNVLSITNV